MLIDALMVLGMVAVTWGARSLPFWLPDIRLGPKTLTFLGYVPMAVLAALVAQPVLDPVQASGNVLQPEVLAALLCLIMGWLRIPMLAVVIVGMASYWAMSQWLF